MENVQGYPDWQRLDTRQSEPLYASENFFSKSLTLGRFYVGNFPAIIVNILQPQTVNVYTVELKWYATKEGVFTVARDVTVIAGEGSQLYKQFICKGQWLEVTFTRISGTSATIETFIQPTYAVVSDSRLGSPALIYGEGFVVESKKEVFKNALRCEGGLVKVWLGTIAAAWEAGIEVMNPAGAWMQVAWFHSTFCGMLVNAHVVIPSGPMRVNFFNNTLENKYVNINVGFA